MSIIDCQNFWYSSKENINFFKNINKFFVRNTQAILTHIFCSLRAFSQLEIWRINKKIENLSEIQKNLSIDVARKFITENFLEVVISN